MPLRSFSVPGARVGRPFVILGGGIFNKLTAAQNFRIAKPRLNRYFGRKNT